MIRSLRSRVLLLILLSAVAAPQAAPQEGGRTLAMAKELTDLMARQKLDAIAARLGEEEFAAALYFPGVQLLVVSARYTAPALINEKIITRQYREVYLDLAAASVPESKLFIEDMAGDGLRAKRDGDAAFDIVTRGTGAGFSLDGDHRKKRISEEEYLRTFEEFEASYVKILTALIEEAKKGS